jgi:hypothetical protein
MLRRTKASDIGLSRADNAELVMVKTHLSLSFCSHDNRTLHAGAGSAAAVPRSAAGCVGEQVFRNTTSAIGRRRSGQGSRPSRRLDQLLASSSTSPRSAPASPVCAGSCQNCRPTGEDQVGPPCRPAHMARPAENVVAFYNKRGMCEQWIKEGKGAIRWTRLSCRRLDFGYQKGPF